MTEPEKGEEVVVLGMSHLAYFHRMPNDPMLHTAHARPRQGLLQEKIQRLCWDSIGVWLALVTRFLVYKP